MIKKYVLALAACVATAGLFAMGGKAKVVEPEWVVKPQQIRWLSGQAVYEPFHVYMQGDEKAAALWSSAKGMLPDGKLPKEGYLLQSGPDGVVALVKDEAAKRWAAQTYEVLKKHGAGAARVADWPDFSMRAYHQIPYTPAALPALKRLVKDYLVPLRANTFIFEIGYAFDFKSDPKVREETYFTKAQIRDFVEFCRGYGIEVIPEVNSIGHQSWKKEHIGGLLTAHPYLEEIPDAHTPQADWDSDQFYCKSWCPLHPKLHGILFPLYDELIDAFQSKAFHIGADEVFVLASEKCPRCKGMDRGEIYGKAVQDLHDHLSSRGQRVLMWGDRLLNDKAHGYSRWDASDEGTEKAVDIISKDILVCDWHYAFKDDYPSLDTLTKAGFDAAPVTYADPRGSAQFVQVAAQRKNDKITGVVASVWFAALRAAAAAFPEEESFRNQDANTGKPLKGGELRKVTVNDKKIMKAARVTLQGAWNASSVDSSQSFPKYEWGGPWPVPGKVQAEDFNLGGEGKAYHDQEKINQGGVYRGEGVDLAATEDKGEEAIKVGWNADGEWQAYDLIVGEAGAFSLDLRLASPSGEGKLEVYVGEKLAATVAVPKTGAWDNWETVTVKEVALPAGKVRVKLKVAHWGYDVNWFEFRRP